MSRPILGFLLTIGPLLASGGGGGGETGGTGTVATTATAEIRIPSETIPAGGTVQVKFLLTEPRPITTSGTQLSTDGFSVAGIALSSPNGEAAGFGVVRNGQLYVSAVSPTGTLGTTLDYPFLTVAMNIPSTVSAGRTFPLDPGAASFIDSLGTSLSLVDSKPGVLTIGGSVSVSGVYPGGGTWPAGTVVRIMGHGFVPKTQVKVAEFKTGPITYVSESELDFVLLQTETMDSKEVDVKNPDGSTDTYYSYLRGELANQSAHVVLANSEPVFQSQTHTFGSITSLDPIGASQFAGLALQNPNPGTASVTISWTPVSGQPLFNVVTLPSGKRLVGDVAELVPGATPGSGDSVVITSTAPVQMLAFYGDDAAWTVTPFLPSF